MGTGESVQEAVELLQQLGLNEYEARCFVGLSRLESGTARRLSETTEVPRTRVYDAIRVLEALGLVEIQHSSPQRFRAVPIEEATETLRNQLQNRLDRLNDALEDVGVVDGDDDSPVQHIWSMAGQDAIENRAHRIVDGASAEVVFVVGAESLLTPALAECLNDVAGDVDLVVGALTEQLQDELRSTVPGTETFVSELGWLRGGNAADGDVAIGRLLMVDRSTILASSIVPDSGDEQAIVAEGFGNGLVVVARRIMAHGLLDARDPGR